MFSAKRTYWIVLAVPIIVLCVVNIAFMKTNNSLVFVNVIFRHGEKTPTYAYTYKNDPHINETYFPYGHGELTLNGKRLMYKVGKELRARYDDFLGVFSHDQAYAVSSDLARTKMSLQSVLAGLFPPTPSYFIGDNLNWQPVDFEVIKFIEDDMIAFWGKCNEYLPNSIKLFFMSEEVKRLDEDYKDLYEYMRFHLGENYTSLFDIAFLYQTFRIQESCGLQLPEWTKEVYPEPLSYLYKQYWTALSNNTLSVKYSAGKLVRTMIDSFEAKIEEKLPARRKINIFVGHEYNIMALLSLLKIEHDFELPFGSYIALELHQIGGIYGVQVYYQDYKKAEPELKQIGNCTLFCPLDEFVALTKNYYPNPNVCLDKSSLDKFIN